MASLPKASPPKASPPKASLRTASPPKATQNELTRLLIQEMMVMGDRLLRTVVAIGVVVEGLRTIIALEETAGVVGDRVAAVGQVEIQVAEIQVAEIQVAEIQVVEIQVVEIQVVGTGMVISEARKTILAADVVGVPSGPMNR